MTFHKTNIKLSLNLCKKTILQNNVLKLIIFEVITRLKSAHYRPIAVFDLSLILFFKLNKGFNKDDSLSIPWHLEFTLQL